MALSMGLFINVMQSIAGAIIAPPMIFVLIVLALVLYFKNKKITGMQKLILGDSVNSTIELTLSQMVLGILGGVLGSIILNSLGVVFNNNSGIMYLFIISIVLMFINSRFICFSYSGAVLGVISIFLKALNESQGVYEFAKINIMYLVIFIGVMHVVEGILVMIDGDRGAIPVFTNADNRILGGYALKRYWVIPICLMIILNDPMFTVYYTEITSVPHWWPLLQSQHLLKIAATAISTIVLAPFFAMTGYSAITFTRSKKRKAMFSGSLILTYGIVMILISQITILGVAGELTAVIVMPVAHEIMLKIQRINEQSRDAKFVSDENGLTILEILPGTEFDKQGIKCGDKILSVNNEKIKNESEIYTILKKSLNQININIMTTTGQLRTLTLTHKKKRRLGILLVPFRVDEEEVIEVNRRSFKSILEDIKEKEIEERDLGKNSNKNKK